MTLETGESFIPRKELTADYDVEEILSITDGEAFLEREYGIEFIPQNGELKACCPIPSHADRTPSFYFNPENLMWRCYGCGAKGNIVGLVMKIEGCSRHEAVYKLAEAAGYSPVTDPSMLIEKSERATTRMINEYLARQSSGLPGQVSAIKFMSLVRERMDKVRETYPEDSAVVDWTESIYTRLDDSLLAENFKGCRALWDGISDDVRQFKQQHRESQTNE